MSSAIVPVLFLLAMILLVTMASSTMISGTNNETDHRALLAFKLKILHDPQGVMTSWNDSIHYCSWQGVTCGRRHRTRVTLLDLRSRELVGFISPHVGNLSFLRSLILLNNTFQGEIPREVGNLFRLQVLALSNNSLEGQIPADLSRCSSLARLGLAYNKLVGNIPRELSSLSKLTRLIIHMNNFTGPIPPFIRNLTSLEVISAAQNAFTGTIPEALGMLKRLTALGFGENNLSGMIPASLYKNLSSITVLSFPNNQLSGSLPANLGSMMPRLQLLELSANQFSGLLPNSLSNNSDMEQFAMYSNNFHGKISIDFSRLHRLTFIGLAQNNFGSGESDEMDFLTSLANNTNLVLLELQGNQLKGTLLPNHVANLSTQLSFLDLGMNHIYGEIPPSITNLVSLTGLGLYGNELTGTIPFSIGYLHNLRKLGLDFNRLEGDLPYSIGNLSSLLEIHLGNNSLQGTIPPSIERCQNLLWLSLPQNNFSGPIPKQLFSISSLSISLSLAGNHFSGLLPPEVGNMKQLGQLDVSDNDLSGELPSSLGSCSSLENLYLQGNSFQGSIPPLFKDLRGIANLDLSRNNLSGQIPKYLGNFALRSLNLSFNHFEGEVPMEGVFYNASAVSVVGNDKLCGGVYGLRLPRCTLKGSKKHQISLAIIVLTVVSSTSLLVAVTLLLLKFCCFNKKIQDPSSGLLFREAFNRVSYRKLLEATEGFSSTHLLGRGSFGSVYRAILDKKTVAVKVLDLQHQGGFKSFKVECEALRNIRHRNLVQILTSCSSVDNQGNDFRALVYEFMPYGSLERWLHMSPVEDATGQNNLRGLNLFQRVNIAFDVACALDYLHHHCPTPIIHCDLKPSNILLDNDMVAHVGDFGLARFLLKLPSANQSSSIGIRGTIGYAPPEYGIGSEVSASGDVYSYGILLLEMMTGKRPTKPMFMEGLNLHKYARRAMPSQVMDIVDPTLLLLLEESEEDVISMSINNRRRVGARDDDNKKVQCLISIVKIGVTCSMESPNDRMDISNVVTELNSVKNILQLYGSQNHR